MGGHMDIKAKKTGKHACPVPAKNRNVRHRNKTAKAAPQKVKASKPLIRNREVLKANKTTKSRAIRPVPVRKTKPVKTLPKASPQKVKRHNIPPVKVNLHKAPEIIARLPGWRPRMARSKHPVGWGQLREPESGSLHIKKKIQKEKIQSKALPGKIISVKSAPVIRLKTAPKRTPGRPVPLPDTGEKIAKKIEPPKKQPDHWSDCGQIFYTSGQAFGIAANLRTIYLGNHNEVHEFFVNGKMDASLSPVQKDTLARIKGIIKEIGNRREAPLKTDVRAGPRPVKSRNLKKQKCAKSH
jgi:hypothetical protein